jgi:hypothetical protein
MVVPTGLMRTAARSGLLMLLALVASLPFAVNGSEDAHAQTQGGAMAVDCEGATRAIETECAFGDGQEFTVAVQVTAAPDGGYWGFQTKLRWGSEVVDYLPTQDPQNEAVWSGCAVQARSDNTAGAPDVPLDNSILYACVPFPLESSTDEGPVLLFSFACTGAGPAELFLVPQAGDAQLGTHFLDSNVNAIDPTLEPATVTCGGPQVERPDPEFGAGNVAAGPDETPAAPVATATAGGPTATTGGPTATTEEPTAEVTPTDTTGDEEDDDGGLPVWAWIAIGVGVVAAVGAGGYALWRRMRSGGTPGGDAAAGSGTPDSGGSPSGGGDAPAGDASGGAGDA